MQDALKAMPDGKDIIEKEKEKEVRELAKSEDKKKAMEEMKKDEENLEKVSTEEVTKLWDKVKELAEKINPGDPKRSLPVNLEHLVRGDADFYIKGDIEEDPKAVKAKMEEALEHLMKKNIANIGDNKSEGLNEGMEKAIKEFRRMHDELSFKINYGNKKREEDWQTVSDEITEELENLKELAQKAGKEGLLNQLKKTWEFVKNKREKKMQDEYPGDSKGSGGVSYAPGFGEKLNDSFSEATPRDIGREKLTSEIKSFGDFEKVMGNDRNEIRKKIIASSGSVGRMDNNEAGMYSRYMEKLTNFKDLDEAIKVSGDRDALKEERAAAGEYIKNHDKPFARAGRIFGGLFGRK